MLDDALDEMASKAMGLGLIHVAADDVLAHRRPEQAGAER